MRFGGTARRDEIGGLPSAEGASPRESDQVQTGRAERLLFAGGRPCPRHHPYGIRPHKRLGMLSLQKAGCGPPDVFCQMIEQLFN